MARSNAGTKGVPRLEREDQILTVASEIFAAESFAAANIQAIADRAGISKPLIYNYFGSKDGLFLACIERAGGIVTDEIEYQDFDKFAGVVRFVADLSTRVANLDHAATAGEVVADQLST